MIDLSRDSDEEGAGGAGVAAGGVAAGGAGVAEGGAGVAEGGLPIDAAAFAARAAVARVAYDLAYTRNTAIKQGPFVPYENQADAFPAGSAKETSWWPLDTAFTARERDKIGEVCQLFLSEGPLDTRGGTFLQKRGLVEVEMFGLPRERTNEKRQSERRLEMPVKGLQTYFSNGRKLRGLQDTLLVRMLKKNDGICEEFCDIITRFLPNLEQEVRRRAQIPDGVNLNAFVSLLVAMPGAKAQFWHQDLRGGDAQRKAQYLTVALGVTDDPLGGTTEFAFHREGMDAEETPNDMLVKSEIHHGNKFWNGGSVHRGGEAFAQRFAVFVVFDSGRRDENSKQNGKWLY